MEEIAKITDIQELESLGYQTLKRRQGFILKAEHEANTISAIESRIAHLRKEKEAEEAAKTEEPKTDSEDVTAAESTPEAS